ncbi:EAL domain-containing protein [Pseudaminobacter salicylatoxidans]|uniref:EAL domain-containing protein n=1 Tax=Pseudaminobacter salicylatoxidans TaxID=93369 RepID=UPI0002DD0A17|nr:EAL domain-containing protein [Pseudaminobacter salicylatoxidans]
MMQNRYLPAVIGQAIRVDELDIATGIVGGFRMTCTYQPIFSRYSNFLRPSGLAGIAGPVPADAFTAATVQDADFAAILGMALLIRNYGHTGIAGLDLHVSCSLDRIANLLPLLDSPSTAGWEDVALGPEKLVCEIVGDAEPSCEVLDALEELSWKGVRMACVFGGAQPLATAVDADVIRLEGAWFRKICAEPTARLLGSMISVWHSRGLKVLVDGIGTAAQLRIALDADADHFQGDFLASAAPAGAIFDDRPVPISAILEDGGKAISLRG